MNNARYTLLFLILSSICLMTYAKTTKTVGGAGANYASLNPAFDVIYAGTITGAITLQIAGSTIETASAVLNANGTDGAICSSLVIYPTVHELSISGNTISNNNAYDFLRTDSGLFEIHCPVNGTEAVKQSPDLDSELNGNDEDKLADRLHTFADPLTIEYGRLDDNTNVNRVSVSHVNAGNFSSLFGARELAMDENQIPDLKTASDFVLFTGIGEIKNTGVSELYGGAIGTNSASIVGFENVNCIQYIQNSVTAQCLLDLREAINSIHNIPITQTIIAADFSGNTYTAGVYLINSAVDLTIDLTLDAEDNPNALFIFNVTGAFNAVASTKIILLRGASIQNIFWNVEAAVNFGAGTSMKGTFLSNAGAITIGANSILEGRALTISGAITIDADILVKCLLPVKPTTSLTQPICSLATGTITITAPTGNGMTYSIDGSDFTNTSGIFTQVPGGIYTVTAKDPGGCVSWENVTIKSFVHAPKLGAVLDFLLFTAIGDIGNTGVSEIIGGAIGTNSGTIVGFTNVNCVQYNQDSVTAQCSLDLQEAFNSIHNIPITQTIIAADISGNTYTAGVYLINSAVNLTMDLTLDGEYNPDALFIFNVTGAFVATASIKIILLNGASVQNIFWNVEAAISIGAGAIMKGTFLSRTGAIDLGDGASLEGRALTILGNINITNTPIEVCIRPSAPTVTVYQPSSLETTGTITITEPSGIGMMYRIDFCNYTNTTGIFTGVPSGIYPVTARNSNGGVSSITYVTIVLPELLTWNGSTSSSWVTTTNWTPQGTPSAETVVIIPDAASTTYDPSIPETGICGNLIIKSGGILNSVNDGQLTVKGANGAWINDGTFAPGTGTVIFAYGDVTKAVTISGTSNFYNLTVSNETRFQPDLNSVINIAGEFTANNSSCILDFGANPNTVGYNGSMEQNVVNPGGIYGYFHLSFSGNGTKVLPQSSVKILGNLSIDAVISATGNTLMMAGTSAQNIGGATAATLNNLTIDNSIGVTLTNTSLTTISGSLLINSGKKFKIAAAQKLSVTGTITNSAGNTGFIMKSDAMGTASLIHNTTNVPATAERFISGTAEAWHFISSPVAAQSISGSWLPSGTYGNGTGYDLYLWNEPNSCWIYKLNSTSLINWNSVHPGQDFVAGRGYLYSLKETNPTKEFSGNLNNGTVSYAMTSNSSDLILSGFNLVGNPYPSSIDWSAATGWTRSNLVASGGGYDMWIWNPSAGNYGTCNSNSGSGTNGVTSYIAPMQGYFVRAASAGNLVTENAVRLHTGAGDWKKGELNPDRFDLVIQSSKDSSYDEVRLQFGFNLDQTGTAKLFSPVVTAPSLYFVSGGADITIQYLTNKIDHPLIPVMFIPGRDGFYTLHCNFDPTNFETVFLEDRQAKTLQDMKVNQLYSFNALKTDAAKRFYLHFNSQNNLSENQLPATIYTEGSQLIVDLIAVALETDVIVYDVIGRKLFQQKLAGGIRHTLNFNVGFGISLVSLQNPEGTLCRKIVTMK